MVENKSSLPSAQLVRVKSQKRQLLRTDQNILNAQYITKVYSFYKPINLLISISSASSNLKDLNKLVIRKIVNFTT
jgi:hypothetical protein